MQPYTEALTFALDMQPWGALAWTAQDWAINDVTQPSSAPLMDSEKLAVELSTYLFNKI